MARLGTGPHGKALEHVEAALTYLDTRKAGDIGRAVRRLEIAAQLLGDRELQAWAGFQLGRLEHTLKVIETDEKDPQKRFEELHNEIVNSHKINATPQEIVTRVMASGGGFASVENIEQWL